MCKLFIAEGGTFYTPAIVRVPARNFVAQPLRDNAIIASIKPIEQNILFLIDTGADATCISALDADRLSLETRFLEPAEVITGVGGTCQTFMLTDIEIGFIDQFKRDRIWFHIEQLPCAYVMAEMGTKMPSLLGLDILSRFDISSDRKKGTAKLKRIEAAPGEYRIVSRHIPPE